MILLMDVQDLQLDIFQYFFYFYKAVTMIKTIVIYLLKTEKNTIVFIEMLGSNFIMELS